MPNTHVHPTVPVSYTHLDVYKRQEYAVQFGSVLSLYGAQPEDISGVILSCVVPSMPVSYTHLDVYKRQLLHS